MKTNRWIAAIARHYHGSAISKHMVNTSGIPGGEVLAALYNAAQPKRGFWANLFNYAPPTITPEEGEKILKTNAYIESLGNRELNVYLGNSTGFQSTIYDELNGKGTAKGAIATIRRARETASARGADTVKKPWVTLKNGEEVPEEVAGKTLAKIRKLWRSDEAFLGQALEDLEKKARDPLTYRSYSEESEALLQKYGLTQQDGTLDKRDAAVIRNSLTYNKNEIITFSDQIRKPGVIQR